MSIVKNKKQMEEGAEYISQRPFSQYPIMHWKFSRHLETRAHTVWGHFVVVSVFFALDECVSDSFFWRGEAKCLSDTYPPPQPAWNLTHRSEQQNVPSSP